MKTLKKAVMLLIVVCNLFCINYFAVSQTDPTDDTVKIEKKTVKKTKEKTDLDLQKEKKQKIQAQFKTTRELIANLKKELRNINKLIATINDGLIQTLDQDKIAALQEKKNSFLLNKSEISQQLVELEILYLDLKEQLSIKKEDTFLPANGTLNWTKEFDISNAAKYRRGKWHVTVKSRDNMSNYSEESSINVIIDPKSDIPTLTVINPVFNQRVASDLKIVGTAYDDDEIEKILVRVDDDKTEYDCIGKEFWYYDLDTKEMLDGNHTLIFKVIDIKGVESKEIFVPFKLDRKTPLLNIDSAPSEVIVSGKMPLTGKALDGNGIRTIEYSIDDRLTFSRVPKLKYLEKDKSNALWSLVVDSDKLIDGVQTIWIRAIDQTGSVGYESLTVMVDHRKPTVLIQYPPDKAEVDGDFTVFGFADDNVGLKRAKIIVKGSSSLEEEVVISPGNKFWRHKLNLRDFSNGKCQITAEVEDISGNIVESIVSVTLNHELDKPVFTLTSIDKDEKFTTSIPVFGYVTDDDKAKEVRIKIYKQGENAPVYEDVVKARYSLSHDVDITDREIFKEGGYKIELVPVDVNDITGNPIEQTFSIDRSNPKFDKDVLNTWAGKSFDGKLELNVSVIKYGELQSVTYSFLNPQNLSEIKPAAELKFKKDAQEGLYICDSIKEDFTGDKIQFDNGIVLVKLVTTDTLNNTSSIIVPVVIDTNKPSLEVPVIDNSKGLLEDMALVVDDNLLLDNVSLSISSSNKEFTPITEMEIKPGDNKEYTLNVKNVDGKFVDYTVNLEAIDVAGNNVKNNFKIHFKDTTADSYNLSLAVALKDNTVYMSDPKVFLEETSTGIDTIDSAFYLFVPDSYEKAEFSYKGNTVEPSIINEGNGIAFVHIDPDTRDTMDIGTVSAEVKFTPVDGTAVTEKLTLYNDVQNPYGRIIWPMFYMPFNKSFTLYGRTYDDSGYVDVDYIMDSDIPLLFTIDDFEKNILAGITNSEITKTLSECYVKGKDEYQLKNNLNSEQLLKILEGLVLAGYEFDYKKAEIDKKVTNTKRFKVPFADPLKAGKTQTLQDFLDIYAISLGDSDQIFKFDINVDEMSEGSHVVYIRIKDNAGKQIYQKHSFIVDKINPAVNVWAFNPKIEEESKDTKEKPKKEKKTKKKEEGDVTGDAVVMDEEAPESEEPAEKTEEEEKERINGEITIRGQAGDNISLAHVVIEYKDELIVLKGTEYWESDYSLTNLVKESRISDAAIPHSIKIYALDLAGNKTNIEKNILIDNKQDVPLVIINNPAITDQRFTGNVDIAGIALDDDGVEYVQYRIDHGLGDNNEKTDGWARIDVDKQSGKWQKSLASGLFESGRHILEVQAIDMYGIKSTVKRITFHLDMENPTVKISSPRNGHYVKGDTVIIGRAMDPNEIQSVQISTNYGWSFVDAEGNESWRYYFDSNSVPDGEMRVLIKSADKAGSESFSFALYNIDNTEPEIEILLPKDSMSVNNRFRIVGRARDNIGIDKVQIYVNTDKSLPDADEEGFAEAEGKEAWYYDIETRKWDPSRSYHLVARVTDLAGNVAERSLDFRVNPISDLPRVEMDQPQPSQHLTGEIIHFFGTASDDEGIEKVYIKIDDMEEQEVKGTDTWSFALPTVNLKPGIHKVMVYAKETDKDGGTGKTSGPISRSFYFDEAGPVVEVKSHINGAPIEHRPWLLGTVYYYEKDLELKLKRQVQEMKLIKLKKKYRRTPEQIPDINEIEVKKGEVMALKRKYLSANRINSVLLSLDNGKTFAKNIGLIPNWRIRLQTQFLEDGPHMLQIKAESKNNKESLQFFRVILDRKIPEVLIANPDNRKVNEKLVVTGSANDNGSIEEVEISLKKFDKNVGKIPKFVQGIYLWAQLYSGPWVSGGFGMTFFDDIVRVEGLFGWTPTRPNIADMGYNPDIVPEGMLRTTEGSTAYRPRYYGFTVGGKLLARILEIPFEFFFGEDARNFSVSVEIGSAFYWFSGFGGGTAEMDGTYYIEKRPYDEDLQHYDAELDGKVLAGFMFQIDFFKVERFGPFRKFALYTEIAFYFIASEIKGGLMPQVGFGIRNAFF